MADLGFTHIYENVRKELDLTRDEYALCNYIQTWASYPGNKTPGWCNRTQLQMAEWVGMSDRGIRKMINRLITCGLISKNERGETRISVRWFELVTHASEEQSSASTRNKVPTNPEQSSASTRNKVPTHKELVIVKLKEEGNNNTLTRKAEFFAAVDTLSEDQKKENAPPSSGAPPQRLTPEVVSEFEAQLSETQLEKWLSLIETDFRVMEGFTITQKIPSSFFGEYKTRFFALARTQEDKYQRRSDVTGHFLNWSRTEYQREKDIQQKQKKYGAELDPREKLNRAYAATLAELDLSTL